ncbi:MAG: tryptophan 2,3-dioxygenase [Saprospirales bacterium]|nr:tryptophan 2,3-dioxygenase [Saprospirales bacterium]MBK7336750.1 tryptophan 2,3-dioxygenase [Saprospirales bacterium]
MSHSDIFSPEELDKGIAYLERLKEKYEGVGQDFFDYLEGLVQSHGLSYWDYIHLNSLLGLQTPRTGYPDEMIFIVYHQITELFFKLIKHELEQLTEERNKEYLDLEKWKLRAGRVVNYFKHLCGSLDIMHSGMDPHQFRQFRMALLPASGFQSVQFRHIELMSAPLSCLLMDTWRDDKTLGPEEQYQHVYWKHGGIETKTGQKTLTLREFERKYDASLMQFIKRYKDHNLSVLFSRLPAEIQADTALRETLREYDTFVNIHWRMSHLASAARYLPKAEEGTGGTNWRQYLPPKFQKIWFFDELWTEEEKEDWGKAGIMKIFQDRIQKSWMPAKKE